VKSLPKLNYVSHVLRQRVFEDRDGVVRKWVAGPDGLDGWRVDVANMTGRHKTSGPQP
jgi:alpha-glucosidase